MHWDKDANSALKALPRLARPLAKRKVEELARARGGESVSLADYGEAKARHLALSGGRPQRELAAMLPGDNRPGANLIVIESCRHELASCPNALIDTALWRKTLEEWLHKSAINERLRARVSDSKVFYHHKLRLAVSGCPNGCARPQVADLSLVGAVRPVFDSKACSSCGECAAACPDGAISLAPTAVLAEAACQGCKTCSTVCEHEAVELGSPFARLYAGGKLGRHPHLADFIGVAGRPEQAVELFSRYVESFLRQGEPNQRFANWWAAQGDQAGPAKAAF